MPFTPPAITTGTLKLCLDASAVTTDAMNRPITDGAPVNYVPPVAGLPLLSQPSAAFQPLWRAAGLNGKPALQFNGSAFLRSKDPLNSTLTGLKGAVEYTSFAVFAQSGTQSANPSQMLWSRWEHYYDPNGATPNGGTPKEYGTGRGPRLGVGIDSTGKAYISACGTTPGSGLPSLLYSYGSTNLGSSAWVGSQVCDTSQAASSQQNRLYLNGVQEAFNIIDAGHSTDAGTDNTSSDLYIGGGFEQGAFGYAFVGMLSLLLIYQGALSDSDRNAVEAALGAYSNLPAYAATTQWFRGSSGTVGAANWSLPPGLVADVMVHTSATPAVAAQKAAAQQALGG